MIHQNNTEEKSNITIKIMCFEWGQRPVYSDISLRWVPW
ncbi:MAG: hypothetical protein ACI936_002291 [Paraglaciecola sp.]|jgi:hypothetical protein